MKALRQEPRASLFTTERSTSPVGYVGLQPAVERGAIEDLAKTGGTFARLVAAQELTKATTARPAAAGEAE